MPYTNAQAEAFWQNVFAGAWSTPRLLFDHSAQGKKIAQGTVESTPPDLIVLRLDVADDAALSAIAEARSAPIEAVIFAAWLFLLHLATDQSELVIGVDVGVSQLLPLRLTVDPEISFAEHLDQVLAAWKLARTYSDYPFANLAGAPSSEMLVPGRPIYPVIFAGQIASAEALHDFDPSTHLLVGVLKDHQDAHLCIAYNRDCFLRETARRYGSYLATLLRRALAKPEQLLRQLDPLPDEDRDRILNEFNATHSDYPRDKRIEELFADQVAANPDQIAVLHRADKLTYQQLDSYASQLADSLRRNGMRPGEPIALLMPREISMVVATLAVLKAGGMYLPIDLTYPIDRIAYLLSDSRAQIMLVAGAAAAQVAADLIRSGHFAQQIIQIDPFGAIVDPAPVVADQATGAATALPASSTDPAGEAAYLMYTSGTTGQPKGALVPHRGVVRLVRGITYVSLNPSTRMLQAGAIGFDATTFEIWGALLNGGSLHIVDREVLLDATELKQFLINHGTNTSLLTPSLFVQLADAVPDVFCPMRDLVVGGDVLSMRHVRLVRQSCPHLRIINGYGPTENSVLSTTHTVSDSDEDNVPIGKPLTNSSVYILSRYGLLQPEGFPGELYVGGDGVGLGYIHRPELSERVFVPHPFVPGATLYRTGDMGRWLPDGSIEFLGRRDHQVKVRGFRVELSEVESQILQLPGVRQAAVLAHPRPASADRYLCAYVVGDETLNVEMLRTRLAERVPIYMLPAMFIRLDAMPLTANGKLDRAALPRPLLSDDLEESSDVDLPQDEIERTIALIWQEVLGVRTVGRAVHLYDLGASSLSASLIAARIERSFGMRCRVAQVLSHPTIEALAEVVRQASEVHSPPGVITPAPVKPLYRLSPHQWRVYIDHVKEGVTTLYNQPIVVDVPGSIDAEHLRVALDRLVQRHEILRTEFVHSDGTTYQRVLPQVPVDLRVVDSATAVEMDVADFVRPFDLEHAPLWRATLCRRAHGSQIIFDIHHIITDGFSVAMLLKEWEALYHGLALPEVRLQYKDYAEWLASPAGVARLESQRAFWLETFRDLPPPLQLPTDAPRRTARSTEGAQIAFELGPARMQELRTLARHEQVTLFHVLLAAYGVFLARITGQMDVAVGVPIAGRNIAGTETIQGMFANTLCLRLHPQAQLDFRTYLHAVAQHAIAAADNQDYPFDDLVRQVVSQRDYRQNPLFDTLFALQNTELDRMSVFGGSPRWVQEATGRTIFDLNLQIHELHDTLRATWTYNTQLFLPPTIDSFCSSLVTIIDTILARTDLLLAELLGEQPTASVDLPDIDFAF